MYNIKSIISQYTQQCTDELINDDSRRDDNKWANNRGLINDILLGEKVTLTECENGYATNGQQ